MYFWGGGGIKSNFIPTPINTFKKFKYFNILFLNRHYKTILTFGGLFYLNISEYLFCLWKEPLLMEDKKKALVNTQNCERFVCGPRSPMYKS